VEIKKIKEQNLYRALHLGSVTGAYIKFKKKKLINLCSNDYLGIPSPRITTSQIQSSSRLVSGNDQIFSILEKKLARHKAQQSALIFPTGYMANLGAISSLIRKGDLVLSDKLNHASIIDACKLCDAKISIYKHNNIEDLSHKVKQKGNRKFIVTEGIFSMDGDIAKLKEICEIAQSSNCIIILDDAHGDFVMGKNGKGTAEKNNVLNKIDVYISSLSKALGAFGGYVTSRKNVIDFLINTSKPFIYTSALPTFLIEFTLKKLELNKPKYRKKLEQNTEFFRKGLISLGYDINSSSHIIPIVIREEKKTMNFGKYLFQKGIFAQPIRFPTVERGKARIRISITSWLSNNDMQKSLGVFELAGKKFGII